jgi:hypothetical protein
MKLIQNLFPAIGRSTVAGFRAGRSALAAAAMNRCIALYRSAGRRFLLFSFCIFNYAAMAGYEVIVTSSTTNLPGLSKEQIYSNLGIFGPWRGSNYVQQAVDALPYYSNGQADLVSGGSVCVLGNNYFQGPLLLTNYGLGYASFRIYSPAFCSGALISRTNPCIVVQDGSVNGTEISLQYENLIISTLQNQTNYLYVEKTGVNNRLVRNCYFGLWLYQTNNAFIGRRVGLSTTTDHEQIYKNDLVVYFNGKNGDSAEYFNNHFLGLAAIGARDDHFKWFGQNSFFAIGKHSMQYADYGDGNGIVPTNISTTDWTTNSPWCTGAALVIFSGNGSFEENHFYGCGAAYLDCTMSGSGRSASFTSTGDNFESTVWSVIHPAGEVFTIKDPTGENPHSATVIFGSINNGTCPANNDLGLNPGGAITDDGSFLNAQFTALQQTGSQNLTNWSNLDTNNVLLKNSIVTNSINSVSGVVTNNGLVWYALATNGTPAIAAPWGSLCTTTNGQLFVRSNNVWLLK